MDLYFTLAMALLGSASILLLALWRLGLKKLPEGPIRDALQAFEDELKPTLEELEPEIAAKLAVKIEEAANSVRDKLQ